MGLKKRAKVAAEFSMASMTDIIFLLLIFFMLTAKLVEIPPFELPESDAKTVAPVKTVVAVDRNGEFQVNGERVGAENLESFVRREVQKLEDKKDLTITIAAEVGTPFENVKRVMEIAGGLQARAILSTQPRG